jgi:elongation factor Ts
MANYTAADVKRLREQTGAGMMDCKNALVEADGDFAAAVEALRVKGVKDAGKRAQRTAAQGLVTAALDGTSAGVLVELNCETDFVAKTDLFQQVAADIAGAALQAAADDRLTVLSLEVRPGQTTQELIEEAGSSLKEKLELGRYTRFAGGYVTSYLHKSDPALPPAIGVLVQLDEAGASIGQDIAHQIAAMRPQYVSREQVPEEVLANERRIAEQVTREEGKPEQAIPKIVEGRLNAFLKDIVLVEQASVREQKKTVKQLLAEQGASVRDFARFQIGQAG